MATNTDWSKFQRKELATLLLIKQQAGDIKLSKLDEAIKELKAQMEKEDIQRVLEELEI